MRLVACATGVLGGACWLTGAVLDGDPARYLAWIGLALLSVTWLLAGYLTASGSLVWLRTVVAIGVLALAWSLVAAALSELPDEPARGVVGGLVLLASIVVFVRIAASTRSHRHHGAHAR